MIPKSWQHPVWLAFLFVSILGVYLSTLCPINFFGDSSEFQTAAKCLGICHPPGYHLWVNTAHSFTYLPLGNIAYRCSLFSALCLAFSGVLVAIIGFRILESGALATGSALFFCFGYSVWSQATVAEVYGLQVVFCLSIFYLFLLNRESLSLRRTALIFFLIGLAVNNHHSTMLIGVFLIIGSVLWWPWRKLLKQENMWLLVFFIMGVSVVLFIPLRSTTDPAIDWSDIDSFTKLKGHISREVYGELTRNPYSLTGTFVQGWVLVRILAEEHSLPLLLLSLFGCYYLFKAQRRDFYMLVLFFLCMGYAYSPLLNFRDSPLDIFLIRVFLLPAFLTPAILVFAGVKGVLYFARKTAAFQPARYAVLLLPVLVMAANWYERDQSHNWLGYWYGRDLLKCLPQNTALFDQGDNQLFPLAYCTIVAKVRPDVAVSEGAGHFWRDRSLNLAKRLGMEMKEFSWKGLETKALEQREIPIFYTLAPRQPEQPFENYGLLQEITEYPLRENDIWRLFYLQPPFAINGHADYMSREILAKYHYHWALKLEDEGHLDQAWHEIAQIPELCADNKYMLVYAADFFSNHEKDEEALALYQKALDIDPNMPSIQEKLAVLLSALGRYDESSLHYQLSLDDKSVQAPTFFNYANNLKRQGRMKEAVAYYQKAIQLQPDFVDAYNNMGSAMEKLKDYQGAIDAYKKALEYEPESPMLLNNLGITYQRLKRFKESKEMLLQALKYDPELYAAHANLGTIFLHFEKDLAKAAYHYQLFLDKGNPTPQQRQQITAILENIKKYEK